MLLKGERADRFEALVAPLNRELDRRDEPPLGQELLTERAAFMTLGSPGSRSANGSCRLLPTRRGWIALNLAREEDQDLLPALLEKAIDSEPWTAVKAAARLSTAGALVDRATLLGLPLARVGEARRRPAARIHRRGTRREAPKAPLVVDFSSLWAGPLCSRILARLGATVVRVESLGRASRDAGAFFKHLKAGQEVRRFDFSSAPGLAALNSLIGEADVVIEASRPRALAQLGIEAERLLAERPGLVWASLTAYGRDQPLRTGFGDDTAAAGGLLDVDDGGVPRFVGDAIADPLSGLVAAREIWAALQSGGGVLIDLSLAGAAAQIARAAGR